MAASAVEVELEKRGLARDHTVSSVSMTTADGSAFYLAQIDPPILIPSAIPATARLAFQVEMDGRVIAKEVAFARHDSRTSKFI